MHTFRSMLAAALVAATAFAQSEHEQLVAEWQAAHRARSAALRALYERADYKAALAANDEAKLAELRDAVPKPDGNAFAAKVLEAGKRHEGDERVPFLQLAALASEDRRTVAKIVEAISRDHLKSKALVGFLENALALSRHLGQEQTVALLRRVAAESPHALPRAWAMYWQAVVLQREQNRSPENQAKAERLLADAEALAAGTDLEARIAAPRFEKERLQIGMVAPDIDGEDMDGVRFRLSDYRGKVVVLDFWGFW